MCVDEWYEDTSSEGSSCSGNYSYLNYVSSDENDHISPRKQSQASVAVTHSHSRFCPGENSSTGNSPAQTCKDVPETNRASTSRDKCTLEMRRLTRNRSLVDMRSQLLHRSLVEEVSKRRLFNTVGSVENIGFQAPREGSRKSSRCANYAASSENWAWLVTGKEHMALIKLVDLMRWEFREWNKLSFFMLNFDVCFLQFCDWWGKNNLSSL